MPRGVNFLQRQNKFFWSLGLANPKPTLGVGEGGKVVGGGGRGNLSLTQSY